jgi:hypothetical protein
MGLIHDHFLCTWVQDFVSFWYLLLNFTKLLVLELISNTHCVSWIVFFEYKMHVHILYNLILKRSILFKERVRIMRGMSNKHYAPNNVALNAMYPLIRCISNLTLYILGYIAIVQTHRVLIDWWEPIATNSRLVHDSWWLPTKEHEDPPPNTNLIGVIASLFSLFIVGALKPHFSPC